MSATVNLIQQRVNALVGQSTTVPTDTGTEYAIRLSFINQALEEWAGAYEWEALRKELWMPVTGVSQASITLPADFQKMAGYPRFHSGGVSGGEDWPEVLPEERSQQLSTDKYFYTLGNQGDGKTMIWNPGTLASGASLLLSYYSYPTSLASPTNILPVEDSEFFVKRVAAYVLQSRNDPRWQQIETQARENLLQLIDRENNKGLSYQNTIKTTEESRWGFRIGRD